MKPAPTAQKRVLIGVCVALCALLVSGLGFYAVRNIQLAKAARQSAGYGSLEANLAAIRNNPNDSGAHRGLAEYYSLRHDYTKAAKELQEVVRIDPNDRYNAFILGATLSRAGRKDEARTVFKKLAEQDDSWGKAAKKRLRKMDSTS